MKIFKVVLAFLLLFNVCWTSASVSCPSPNQGCDCENAFIGFVRCPGVNSLPQSLPSNVTMLDFSSSSIGSVLLAIQIENLSNFTVSQLFLGNSRLRAIEERAFVTQSSIRTLDLSNNDFKRLDGQIFFNLTNLKSLFLTESSIHEITSLVFTYTPELEFLDLGGNMLTQIANQFSSLSNLRTLLLSSNQISTIADDALQNQKQLIRLDISGNRLTKLPKSLFAMLVKNNGNLTLKSDDGSVRTNNWSCCGQPAVDYKGFFEALPTSLHSRHEYDIACSSPKELAGKRIAQVDLKALKRTPCDETITSTPNTTEIVHVVTFELTSGDGDGNTSSSTELNPPTLTPSTADRPSHRPTDAHTTDGSTEAAKPPQNAFGDLTNLEIALILIGTVLVVALITAIAVRCYESRSQKRALIDIIRKLPNSIEIDADEDAGVENGAYDTPRPVSAADSHRNEPQHISPLALDDNVYDTPRPMKRNLHSGVQRPSPSERMKAPKRTPLPMHRNGLDNFYEQTQFNNSSSACLNNGEEAISSGFWYESDESDGLWDVNNVR